MKDWQHVKQKQNRLYVASHVHPDPPEDELFPLVLLAETELPLPPLVLLLPPPPPPVDVELPPPVLLLSCTSVLVSPCFPCNSRAADMSCSTCGVTGGAAGDAAACAATLLPPPATGLGLAAGAAPAPLEPWLPPVEPVNLQVQAHRISCSDIRADAETQV